MAKLKNAQPYNVADAAKLARAGDPWEGYASLKQSLPKI
jgi:hypothetical protein